MEKKPKKTEDKPVKQEKKLAHMTARIPPAIKKRVETLAAKDRRSYSAMVIILIEEALDARNA